jgi:hypothetical protein
MEGRFEPHVNTIATRACHKDLYEIMKRDLEDFARTCSKFSQKGLLHKVMQGPLTAFQWGPRKIFSQGIFIHMAKVLMPGPRRETHQIVIKRVYCYRGASTNNIKKNCYNKLVRASRNSIHTSISQTWHLKKIHTRRIV